MDDFSMYITWNPNCAAPGAYIGLYRPMRTGGGVWVTMSNIMLFPTHWAPLEEVFDSTQVEAP